MRQAFTVIELLVVIAIVALLMGILMPVLGRARLQAKVVVVNAELRGIGMALDSYSFENNGKCPPTRVDCMIKDNYYQLPKELVEDRYLPEPPQDNTWRSTTIYDRFNSEYTYKYVAVGDLIVNRGYISKQSLWVPDGFLLDEKDTGKKYNDPAKSPVRWVIYSLGPKFDLYKMKEMHYPVPRRTWYNPKTRKGIITRMRLKKGRHIGSFETKG